MDRLQIRGEVRDIVQETLQYIIDEIDEEVEDLKLKRKRKWVKDRVKQDTNSYLLPELAVKGPTDHFKVLNMTEQSFYWLLEQVEPFIQKTDTVMRMALPAILKLEIILNLFATGNRLRDLEQLFNVSKTSISLMIHRVCDAICFALKDFNKVPIHEEWRAVATGFKNTWNFPRCCGAIGGKLVVNTFQNDTGNNNHKIALLAICDDDYSFKYVDVWSMEKLTIDIFGSSNLMKELEHSLLPPEHVVVGNENFPLKKYLMIPYDSESTEKEKVFNHRLNRARSVIENSFGLLVSRFRIFANPFPFTIDKTEKIIKTCCALHNWLRMTKCSIQVATLDVEDSYSGNIIPGSWRELVTELEALAELPKNIEDCSTEDAKQIRDDYADYFVEESIS